MVNSKKLLTGIVLAGLFISQTTFIFAQSNSGFMIEDSEVMEKSEAVEDESVNENTVMEDKTKDSEESMEAEVAMDSKIDSFELFWPIAAGKTRGESLYFLKRIKEKLRGLLIFGNAKDAEYDVFLATKRVVEAEKLINNDKHELATKTIGDAIENLDEAQENWDDVENRDTPVKHEMNNKLDNLETFLPYLSTLSDNTETNDAIQSLLEKVTSLNGNV